MKLFQLTADILSASHIVIHRPAIGKAAITMHVFSLRGRLSKRDRKAKENRQAREKEESEHKSGAPNEDIAQNHLNIALLHVF